MRERERVRESGRARASERVVVVVSVVAVCGGGFEEIRNL